MAFAYLTDPFTFLQPNLNTRYAIPIVKTAPSIVNTAVPKVVNPPVIRANDDVASILLHKINVDNYHNDDQHSLRAVPLIQSISLGTERIQGTILKIFQKTMTIIQSQYHTW